MSRGFKKLFIDDDLYDPIGELDTLYYDTDEDEDIEQLLGAYLKTN